MNVMKWHNLEQGGLESILFVGGIGDMLMAIFQSDVYTYLETLKSPTVEIIGIEINPHLHEIFTHHPNRKNLLLSWAGLDDFPLDEAWRLRNNVAPFRTWRPRTTEVVFYPSPEDEAVLSALPPRYACFAISAGHPERNLPPEISRSMADACLAVGITPVYIGRNYKLTSGLCSHEHREMEPGAGINLVDKLTLPGSLACIERAAVTFSAYSSAMLMAQFRKKPVFVAYPDKLHNLMFHDVNNERFVAMCGQPGSTVVCETDATREAMDSFLSSVL